MDEVLKQAVYLVNYFRQFCELDAHDFYSAAAWSEAAEGSSVIHLLDHMSFSLLLSRRGVWL